jgi:zinc and cadmium transporter
MVDNGFVATRGLVDNPFPVSRPLYAPWVARPSARMETLRHSEIYDTLAALASVSVASVAGSASFALGRRLQTALPYLVSAAAGALLGTALTHLLPEGFELLGSAQLVGVSLLVGFVFSFLLEHLLWLLFYRQTEAEIAHASFSEEGHFHHRHEYAGATGNALAANILFSGGVHSFIDGIAVAAAFAVSHTLGIATTIAVLIHEVPHHLADVAVLVYSGMTKGRAVLLNFVATMGCATGGLCVLAFGSKFRPFTAALLPFTAANFLYIAMAILMPELQKEQGKRRSTLQTLCLIGAAALMWGLSIMRTE